MNAAAVKTENLTKIYKKPAVDGLNLTIHRGEIYGFLGPNGAGKTTSLKRMAGLIWPTSGTCKVLEHPSGSVEGLSRIGTLIEYPAFYPYLTGRRNLQLMARYSGVPMSRIDEVLDQVELSSRAKDKFQTYSMGMKQRLVCVAAYVESILTGMAHQ